MREKFIVLEGLDGAGHTTQARRLTDYLNTEGYPSIFTHEPTNGEIGSLIRRTLAGEVSIPPYALQLLFCADRDHHLSTEIEPRLFAGTNVISDRYIPSTLAYGAASFFRDRRYAQNGIDWWDFLMKANGSFRVPDLTMILDLSVDDCMRRIESRGGDKEIFEKRGILIATQDGYRRFASEYPNVIILNAQGDADEVHDKIKSELESKFSLRI